ncbi:asparagine synthase (glutamine-hydrolyzing) [Aquirufa lenticrescens]
MCGIAGFIVNQLDNSDLVLHQMISALKHRGPDGTAQVVINSNNSKIGLAHSRLSIIDLDKSANQPMIFRHLTVVFNGEIYNHSELRAQLVVLGRVFSTNSDTEVLLQSIDEWGLIAVNKFVGMFSFVLYNEKQEKLFLFRDRLGVKPLYYFDNGSDFLFASEIKSFFNFPTFEKEINKNALVSYLNRGYISSDIAIYKNIHKVPPGNFLELKLGTRKIQINKYWELNKYFSNEKSDVNILQAQEDVEELLVKSCKYRMVSDVPVGVFLSGGYDSSTVAAILRNSTNQQIKTFTIGFEDNIIDESRYAKKIASFLETEHTECIFQKKDLKSELYSLYDHFDEPFADISALPTLLLSRMAKEKVSVALSSDGGDEAFGGYTKYSYLLKYNKFKHIPIGIRVKLSNSLKNIDPLKIPYFNKKYNFGTRYNKALNLISATSMGEAYFEIGSVFNFMDLNSLLISDFEDGLVGISNINYSCSNDDLDCLLYKDYMSYLVDDVLVKVDRSTMSCGLEGREPLLDHNLVEYVAGLPSNYKIYNGDNKYLLKRICNKYIPNKLLERPKMGFGIPMIDWFDEDIDVLINNFFNYNFIKNQGLFNIQYIEQLINNYKVNKSMYITKIWTLLSFQLWYNNVHIGKPNYK